MVAQETQHSDRRRLAPASALAAYTYVYHIASRYVYGIAYQYVETIASTYVYDMATSETLTKSTQSTTSSVIWNYATTPAPSSRNSAFASRAYKQVIPDTFTSSNCSDPPQEHTYDGGHSLPAGGAPRRPTLPATSTTTASDTTTR